MNQGNRRANQLTSLVSRRGERPAKETAGNFTKKEKARGRAFHGEKVGAFWDLNIGGCQ
jgi:hypothetical protein